MRARRRGSRSRRASPLFGVPSSSSSSASMPAWSAASSPNSAGAIVSMTFSTAVQHALAAVARPCRRRAARPPRGRPVEAPDGTAARPDRPVGEDDVDLDGGVAARVEDLAGVDDLDRRVVTPAFPAPSRRPSRRLARRRPVAVEQHGDAGQLAALEELERRAAAGARCGSSCRPGPAASTAADRVAAADDHRRAVASARSARSRAIVPRAVRRTTGSRTRRAGRSRRPSATSASASSISSPASACRRRRCASDAGIFSAGSVLYSVPRVTSLATITSTGRTTRTPLLLGRGQDPPGVLDAVVLGEALADGLALGEQERVGHAAADDEHVDLRQQVLEHLDLVARPWPRR